METPLSLPEYEHLRELPDESTMINPLAAGAKELVLSMVEDVLKLMPNIRYFHLGGDEAWAFGSHPDCKAYIEKHGKGALYLQHVKPVLDKLNNQKVRPILWHDMMVEWESQAIKELACHCDLLAWGYAEHPDISNSHYNTKYIQRFYELGVPLWGGAAYKGASGQNVDLPDLQLHEDNALAWMEVAGRFNFKGVVATAWSRYSTDRVQCEPIDAALDSLVNLGVIFHDGKIPAGGISACVEALQEIDEKERFLACKRAMQALTNCRRQAWEQYQILREEMVLCKGNKRKGLSREVEKTRENLCKTIAGAHTIADEVKKVFQGLIPSIWIEEYLLTRIKPLEEDLLHISSQL